MEDIFVMDLDKNFQGSSTNIQKQIDNNLGCKTNKSQLPNILNIEQGMPNILKLISLQFNKYHLDKITNIYCYKAREVQYN